MKNKLLNVALNIKNENSNMFLEKTNSDLSLISDTKQVVADYSWINLIDESIPYIDAIIRNPRRFIQQEEELAPVEKTKKITKETIKHLSQHTGLIQDVDEDGMVLPLKLLNVYKEETIDLYENRFVYSLIKNLSQFLQPIIVEEENESYKSCETKGLYEANTGLDDQKVKIEIKYIQAKKELLDNFGFTPEEIKEKKDYFKQIISDFMSSQFMKAMHSATPVRSPIRKTNVILKDPNFQKALELWEFLESYQVKKPIKEEENTKDILNENIKNDFDWIYYGLYNQINNQGITKLDSETLYKLIIQYLRDNNISEIKFKNKINSYLDKIIKDKIKRDNYIKKCYNEFINSFKNDMKNAIKYLK